MIHASCRRCRQAETPILQVRAKLDACARNTEKQTCPTRGNNSCHGVIAFLSRCSNLWPVVNTRSKTRCRKTCENIGPVLWSEAATRRVVGGKHGRPDSRDCVRATLVSARNCDDIDPTRTRRRAARRGLESHRSASLRQIQIGSVCNQVATSWTARLRDIPGRHLTRSEPCMRACFVILRNLR